MTDTIKRLRALHEAATDVPWVGCHPDAVPCVTGPACRVVGDWSVTQADAELIAAMRNALPALLDVASEAAAARDGEYEVGYQIRLEAALARLDGEL